MRDIRGIADSILISGDGKGVAFGDVARAYDTMFKNWMEVSGLNHSKLKAYLNRNEVRIDVLYSDEGISVSLKTNNECIGLPFVWGRENTLQEFWVDVFLLINIIRADINDDNFHEVASKFIESNLHKSF